MFGVMQEWLMTQFGYMQFNDMLKSSSEYLCVINILKAGNKIIVMWLLMPFFSYFFFPIR